MNSFALNGQKLQCGGENKRKGQVMAMNIAGIRKRVAELILGVEDAISNKEVAISAAEDREDESRVEVLNAQLDILNRLIELFEEADYAISEWEG